jgi:hypothetical protein
MQGLRLGQYGGSKSLGCGPHRGIVDARRRLLLPALTARLQRELTVITATTCDHDLKLGLEPMAAARRGADVMTPALSRTQRPSHWRANRLRMLVLKSRAVAIVLMAAPPTAPGRRPQAGDGAPSRGLLRAVGTTRRRVCSTTPQPPVGPACASATLGARLAGGAHGRRLDPTGVRS